MVDTTSQQSLYMYVSNCRFAKLKTLPKFPAIQNDLVHTHVCMYDCVALVKKLCTSIQITKFNTCQSYSLYSSYSLSLSHTCTQLIELYGPDADKHLFRCLVSSIDFTTDGRNLGKDGQQLQLLIQEANALITKPNFVSILCYAFEKQEVRERERPKEREKGGREKQSAVPFLQIIVISVAIHSH